MDKNEYKIKMLKVLKMLREEDVESLKYIFSDIGQGVLEKVKTPLDLIKILEMNSLVNADNLELFTNALENLGRYDIVKTLKEKSQVPDKIPVQEVGFNCIYQNTSSNNESKNAVMIDKKEPIDLTKNPYDTKLTAAIRLKYDIESIEQIVKENPSIINTPERKFDELPIILAVNHKNMELLKFLLDQGADINKKIGEYGITALYNAVLRKNHDAATILLKHKQIDMCIRCCEAKNTALHCAVSIRDIKMVEILVQYAKEKGVLQKLMTYKNKNELTPDKVSTATSSEAITRLKMLVDDTGKDNAAAIQQISHGGHSYTINNPNNVSITNVIYSPTSLNNNVPETSSSQDESTKLSSPSYESSKPSSVLLDKVTKEPNSSDEIMRELCLPSDKELNDFYVYMQLRQFHLSSMQNEEHINILRL
ncbi:uncharacterized protein LOC101235779 isoform X1 [Hydra vulgaris]|uniref:uncharacterized protein LOC101235779 isoform X1 n=2 Tax=Hydra vulgaris TaxID=6087 RepID=UPI001F5E6FC2|nr:uncharacterized protein LOC101235779 isoform X1 [Hydra vulgaris]